jgi:hypothetical protein
MHRLFLRRDHASTFGQNCSEVESDKARSPSAHEQKFLEEAMRKILILALAFVFALSTAACGNNSGNSSEPPPDSVSDDGDEQTDSRSSGTIHQIARPPVSAELSTEWSSFQFELEGKIYTLPILYSELEADGWTTANSGDLDETLEAGNYIVGNTTLVNSNKENSEVSVQFANLGDADATLKECYVSGVQFAEYSWNKATYIYFPGGFTIGSAKDEVQASYGEPSEIQEYSSTIEWKYQTQIYDGVTFTFTKETGAIEQMRMTNLYLP